MGPGDKKKGGKKEKLELADEGEETDGDDGPGDKKKGCKKEKLELADEGSDLEDAVEDAVKELKKEKAKKEKKEKLELADEGEETDGDDGPGDKKKGGKKE